MLPSEEYWMANRNPSHVIKTVPFLFLPLPNFEALAHIHVLANPVLLGEDLLPCTHLVLHTSFTRLPMNAFLDSIFLWLSNRTPIHLTKMSILFVALKII